MASGECSNHDILEVLRHPSEMLAYPGCHRRFLEGAWYQAVAHIHRRFQEGSLDAPFLKP